MQPLTQTNTPLKVKNPNISYLIIAGQFVVNFLLILNSGNFYVHGICFLILITMALYGIKNTEVKWLKITFIILIIGILIFFYKAYLDNAYLRQARAVHNKVLKY